MNRNKKVVSFVFSLSFVLLTACGQGSTTAPTISSDPISVDITIPSSTPTKPPQEGIKIGTIDGWEKKESFMGRVTSLVSPKENADDAFQENVKVIIEDLPSPGTTLDDYTQTSISKIKDVVVGSNIVSENNKVVANIPAYEVVYTGKQEDYRLKFKQVWTIKNNRAYTFTFTSEESTYPQYIDKVDQFISTFEIK